MSKLVILSDIHANLSALQAVIKDFQTKYEPDALLLLGDLVDYGMRPNEVIEEIEILSRAYPILCNLYGNHEKAVISPQEHLPHFSSERGRQMLEYTCSKLSQKSIDYIQNMMESSGQKSLQINGQNILCVHGSLDDPYWGKLGLPTCESEAYMVYDYVFSGHTHLPHYIEFFYKADLPEWRNKKKTVFLNPGSVGQPRNQNPCAQYLYVDLSNGVFHHNSVAYDIAAEQKLFTEATDIFYRERLSKGI